MLVRPLKILLGTAAIITFIIIVVGVVLYSFDWNSARPWINAQISRSLGRDFAVRGDLHLALAPTSPTGSSWERYLHLPLVRISADDVQLANPAWSHTGDHMASVKQLVITLQPWPLLHQQVIITELDLDTPQLALEQRANGSNSWSLPDNGPSNWHLQIQRLVFGNGSLRILNESIQLDLRAKASSVAGAAVTAADSTIQQKQQFDLHFVLAGTYRHTPITGSGKLGSVLHLDQANTEFPVAADLHIGSNNIAFDGLITDPSAPSGINLNLMLAGSSLSELYPLTGVLLPVTAPYKIQGRLLGQNKKPNWNWTYQHFAGTMGASDLAGSLEYIHGLPRPTLRGAVSSNQLNLADLGPVVGARSSQKKTALDPAPPDPNEKVLPTEQFHTDQWGALNADVKFSGKHLVRTHQVPLENIVAEIRMQDQVLSLSPLQFGFAGGNITANIIMDGRTPPIAAQINIAARGLKLRELFPPLPSMSTSLGEINGDAALTGHGNAVSTMLATSNGEFAATVSPGSVSRYMLELAGLNVANALFVKIFGDQQVRLNCLVSNFAVKDGVADVRRFVVDTDDAVVNITGDIDLSRERLNLDVIPDTKGMRIFSLHSPLYAKGSFAHPDIGPYKGPLFLRATAAVALGILFPPAAALATVNMGRAPVIDCPAELSQALQTRGRAKSEATATRVDRDAIQKNRLKK